MSVQGMPASTNQASRRPSTTTAANGKMIQGDDVDPESLASAVDAALDAAAQQILANQGDIASLPGWAQQVMSLAISAGETVDELLMAMDIHDPDDGSSLATKAQLQIAAYLQYAKDFSAEERDALAKKGHALPDGSFPIVKPADVDNAVSAFGRAKNKAAAKAHIKKRALALGVPHKLPDGWK